MIRRPPSSTLFPSPTLSRPSIPPFSEALARFVDREWEQLKAPEAVDAPWLIDGLVNKSRGRFTAEQIVRETRRDRKSTRLNSSHANISYAVFCLKKKNIKLY